MSKLNFFLIRLCSHRITATGNRQTITAEFFFYVCVCCLAVFVNSPLNFELKYVVVPCITEIVTEIILPKFY
jgi:hypothetical protein